VISDVPAPWWVKALPTWIAPLEREHFYTRVRDLRKVPYRGRLDAADHMGDLHVIFRFCVFAEASGLEKNAAAKVVKLFRLVKSEEEFLGKLPEKLRPARFSLEYLLLLTEEEKRYEESRLALIPRRERKLSREQIEGLTLLQTLEATRVQILAEYQREEEELLQKLRERRAERDEFSTQLKHLVPEWAQVQQARRARLTQGERDFAIAKFEQSEELRTRFTVESFLAAAQQNKTLLEESKVYTGFCRFRVPDNVVRAVRRARAQAGEPPAGSETQQVAEQILPE